MATANRKSVKRRRRSYFLSDFGPLDIAVADYSPSGIPIFLNSTGTDISLVSSANPVPVGQSVTFTATVTASTGQQVPTGTVKFADDQVVLAVVTLNSGEAILTTSFSATGTHNIHSWALSLVVIQNEPRTVRYSTEGNAKDMARGQVHTCRSRLRSRTL